MRKNILVCVVACFLCSNMAFARLKTAVLHLCFEKDGLPFVMASEDEEVVTKNGFKPFRNSELYIRPMKLYLDGVLFTKYKPRSESCLTVYKITPGTHEISVDFKSAAYTNLEAENSITYRFKADLLYKGKINVVKGASASVLIQQEQNTVSIYQSVDNKPIQNCDKQCAVPTNVPVYFMIKSEDEKVPCPVSYELIVATESELGHTCYQDEKIREQLKRFVKERETMCRVNVEYAFFKIFGDGCLLTMASDKSGLREKDPEIRLLPLEQQKIRYYISINGSEPKIYSFSGDRKGATIVPRFGDKIEFVEVRDR